MSKYLLSAAAVLALIAPGVAAANTAGSISFAYNSLDDDNDSNKEDYLALGGAVATPLGDTWNLQFDAEMSDLNHNSHTDTQGAATVHAFMRGDSFAFGGFGGFTNANIDGYVLGAEGALYLGRFSLAGTAFFGSERGNDDTEISGLGATGTFFITDNFSLGGDVSHTEFDFGFGTEDGTIYGLTGEYQFAGSGFSIYGGYYGSDQDNFGTDREVTSFQIGGRYNFGTANLFERDRSGASMLGASQLPRHQVFSW